MCLFRHSLNRHVMGRYVMHSNVDEVLNGGHLGRYSCGLDCMQLVQNNSG